MRLRFGVGGQLALVLVLFLGSLAILLWNSFTAFWLPQREQEAREHVGEASRRMAEAAGPLIEHFSPDGRRPPHGLDDSLAEVTERVLSDFPSAEGGFYLAGGLDQFTAYAFPTRPSPSPPPSDDNQPKHRPAVQRDPPPRERGYIHEQAQRSVAQESGTRPLVQAYEVEASRVVVATDPVGSSRPAPLAAWVMVRLTGRPDQQREALKSYQLSTGLAYGAIVLAVLLTANLGRTLVRERRQRERLREELRRAEHLAALGKLLAGVAHEVRNPLAGIRSTVQLWLRLPDLARTPESLDAVIQSVDRLSELVSRLLYFARTGADEPRPVDLNSVVRDTLELLRAQAAAQGVTLEADLAPELPFVSGSDPALRQVVLNLATNALQAMPRGGRLLCRTASVSGGQGVELRVADTGPGVAPEARAHLFEPFFTTRPEGTGLGLALCREIVLQHGGAIELVPGEGPGATFRVVLPSSLSPLAPEAGARGEEKEFSWRGHPTGPRSW
jgi:signal transduction histidine kinase